MSAVRSLEYRCSSMEEFSLAARTALGWELDFRQLAPGAESSGCAAVATGHAALNLVDFDSRVHQQALPPAGFRAFGVLAGPQRPGKIGTRVLDSESLLYVDPYFGLDAVVESGFRGFTMAYREERLQQVAQALELPDPVQAGAGEGTERVPDPRYMAAIRSALHHVIRASRGGGTPDAIAEILDCDLPRLILQAWYGTPAAGDKSAANRARVVAVAMEYLCQFGRDALTVEQLAVQCSCSISTLERAFAEHFGVSPKRYLLIYRMSGARRVLLDSRGERTISDVANDWGFWHLGKFAADYKKLFGELPSRTVAGSWNSSVTISPGYPGGCTSVI